MSAVKASSKTAHTITCKRCGGEVLIDEEAIREHARMCLGHTAKATSSGSASNGYNSTKSSHKSARKLKPQPLSRAQKHDRGVQDRHSMPRSVAGRSKSDGTERFAGTASPRVQEQGFFGNDYAGGRLHHQRTGVSPRSFVANQNNNESKRPRARTHQTSTNSRTVVTQSLPVTKVKDLWRDNLVLDSSHSRCMLPQHDERNNNRNKSNDLEHELVVDLLVDVKSYIQTPQL